MPELSLSTSSLTGEKKITFGKKAAWSNELLVCLVKYKGPFCWKFFHEMRKYFSYHLFGIYAIVLLLASAFVGNKSILLNLYHSPYEVSLAQVYHLMAVVLIVCWCLYYLYGSFVFSSLLKKIHILLTSLIAAIIALVPLWIELNSHGILMENQLNDAHLITKMTILIAALIAVFLVTPFLLIINMGIGILKKNVTQKM